MSRRFSRRHSGPPHRAGVPARSERPDVRRQTPLTPSDPEPDLGPAVAEPMAAAPPEEVAPGDRASLAGAPPFAVPVTPGIASPLEPLKPEDGTPTGRGPETGCTAAQLRRFIKSRPYVPMHELRRRFELNGGADDVTPIATSMGIVFLGLPDRESQFVADLVRQGDVGLEICRDPSAPMVVGVFAMKPISRQ
jgi:hypothetical protein